MISKTIKRTLHLEGKVDKALDAVNGDKMHKAIIVYLTPIAVVAILAYLATKNIF